MAAAINDEIQFLEKHPMSAPIETLDGHDFKHILRGSYAWLTENHTEVNALNVFPVPDGDTGTNMLLTMQSAWEEIENTATDDLGRILQAASHGALMGARGNSGVILSQILRGFARSLEHVEKCNALQLAEALRQASDTAYKGVVKPVEGTILTVIRLTAEAAERAAQLDPDLRFVFSRLVHAADEAVQKTPTLLPVLAQAGVVDSGGKGLFFLLDGMSRALHGESMSLKGQNRGTFAGQGETLDGEYGYDIQFIVQGTNLNVDEIRQTISEMGDSVLVVGDSRAVKVHLHAPEPGHALNYGAKIGHMSRVIVENMDAQFEKFVHGNGIGDGPLSEKTGENHAENQATLAEINLGAIAVAPGKGFENIFLSLGASKVVAGGQTMNPSTQELLAAINAVPSETVVILPNNSNILLTAEQARKLSGKKVHVIPSKTVPQGISALVAFQPNYSVSDNLSAMTNAIDQVQTGEVTVAVRAAKIDGLEVHPGDVIGMLNDKLTTRGHDTMNVVCDLLQQMHADDLEIISIYYGQPVTEIETQQLRDRLKTEYPQHEIELINGGQPHYHYILSAE